MAGLAKVCLPLVSAGDPSLIDRRSGKPRRITAKVKKAVSLLLNGDVTTLKAAAERTKVHPDYLSRSFRKPHVMLFIDSEARARLATGKLAATSRLLDLLHAESEHVSFDAAKHTLAVNGIRPEPDQNLAINLSVSPGYCIDLQTDPREAFAANHPLAQLRTIEGHGDVTPAPALREPPRAIPPFPGYVQTGADRHGNPIFAPEEQKENDR